MPRLLVPLVTPDLSGFAKALKRLLDERHAEGKPLPTHVELLNLLARAGGVRNFQTLQAAALAAPPPDVTRHQPPVEAAEADIVEAVDLSVLSATARKALMQFDSAGRLVRLPNKLSVQQLANWALWTHFETRRKYTEKEVNGVLNAHHTFGDQATLRRELVNMKLLGRKSDCSEYWKEPQRPTEDVQAFLRAWRAGMK